MTPYVELQKAIIQVLQKVANDEPSRLKRFARSYCKPKQLSRSKKIVFCAYLRYLETKGLVLPSESSYPRVQEDCLEIIRQQIEIRGSKITIRNILGGELYNYGPPIGYAEYIRIRGGGGANRLRTERFSHPGSLKKGDVLATGDRLLSPPREGGNGSVLLHLTGGFDGHWIDVPARIPIALLTKADKAPPGLVEK